jgi:hypothetical protein
MIKNVILAEFSLRAVRSRSSDSFFILTGLCKLPAQALYVKRPDILCA